MIKREILTALSIVGQSAARWATTQFKKSQNQRFGLENSQPFDHSDGKDPEEPAMLSRRQPADCDIARI
jgi:hypothetical protein